MAKPTPPKTAPRALGKVPTASSAATKSAKPAKPSIVRSNLDLLARTPYIILVIFLASLYTTKADAHDPVKNPCVVPSFEQNITTAVNRMPISKEKGRHVVGIQQVTLVEQRGVPAGEPFEVVGTCHVHFLMSDKSVIGGRLTQKRLMVGNAPRYAYSFEDDANLPHYGVDDIHKIVTISVEKQNGTRRAYDDYGSFTGVGEVAVIEPIYKDITSITNILVRFSNNGTVECRYNSPGREHNLGAFAGVTAIPPGQMRKPIPPGVVEGARVKVSGDIVIADPAQPLDSPLATPELKLLSETEHVILDPGTCTVEKQG